MPEFDCGAGVLPDKWIRKAHKAGLIHSSWTVPPSNFQPASLDLRLGEDAYRLRCSFLPDKETVEGKLEVLAMEKLDIRDGAILEQNRPYLVPLKEELALPPTIRARANPKSSTGRLDVFTRVITDKSARFDDIAPGYEGKLYLEVVPRSFTIKVFEDLTLNQLRLMSATPKLSDNDIRQAHACYPILFDGHIPVPGDALTVENGLFLSLDLSGYETRDIVGYRAKRNSHLVDLSAESKYDPFDFWEPVKAERRKALVLEPEQFYLLMSKERVRVPPDLAAEMTAYDPTSGELRTHYAGFFDPGFGHDEPSPDDNYRGHGTKAALEVRAHDVPFMVEHGQNVCKLTFEKMVEPSDLPYGTAGSHYQFQIDMLSKHFVRARLEPLQLPLKLL
jgi:dCTP deaminase